jgi:hypothetical protein
MANGTPTIGLAYTSDQVTNENLDRIDAALALVLPEEATLAGKAKRAQEELARQAEEQAAEAKAREEEQAAEQSSKGEEE